MLIKFYLSDLIELFFKLMIVFFFSYLNNVTAGKNKSVCFKRRLTV